MAKRSTERQAAEMPEELKQALETLLVAFQYAADTQSPRWDFAVSIRRLWRMGLNEEDLRWLVRKGYVEHAREVTVLGDDGRAFRPTGDLTFVGRTCFVLTDAGVANAQSLSQAMGTRPSEIAHDMSNGAENGRGDQDLVVHWDAEARRLRVNGRLVKHFKWQAANQEAVLNAFQEEGWPERIDDPLSPQPEQDPKRRLSDTIKCLNRKQANELIHFRGDGTGEGIVWEFVKASRTKNGRG